MTSTVAPTIQPATATPTFTVSPSRTPTATVAGLSQNCFVQQQGSLQAGDYHGSIAFGHPGFQYFLNLDTGQTTEIPKGKHYLYMSVSPDRKKYAYQEYQSDPSAGPIVVMSATGQLLRSIPMQKNWWGFLHWQNNDSLLIKTTDFLQTNGVYPPHVLVSFNIVTGQVQKLIPNFPNIYDDQVLWESGPVFYDPSMTRAVYPDMKSRKFVLWDLKADKNLMEVSGSWRTEPVWSPDGSNFFTGVNLVSRDGVITRFPVAADVNENNWSGYYSWSPNGDQVAFWSVGSDVKLVILDLATGKLMDTCIKMGYDVNLNGHAPYLSWSPDGKQVIAYANYDQQSSTWDVVLVDLQKRLTVKVAENIYALGWMSFEAAK